MARRFDPRYDVPQGYATGGALVDFAQLLRQGFGDYERQTTLDEESRRRDQDLMLRLQQFLSQSEDRDLDREIKQGQLGELQEAGLASRQDRAATAAQAGRERAASGDFFSRLGKMRPTQEPVTPPAIQGQAISPQAEDRALARFLWGQRRSTPLEVSEEMGPATQDLPTDIRQSILKEATERDKLPKPPEPFTLGKGQKRFGPTGEPIAEVPDDPKEPKPADLDSYTETALSGMGLTRATATKEDIQKATELAEKRRSREQGAGAGARAESTLPFEVYERRLKEAEAIVNDVQSAHAIVDQIDGLIPKLPKVRDAGERIGGAASRELGVLFQTNPDATEFRRKLGFLAQLARTFGERGVLTNQDVERVQQLLPSLHDTDEVKRRNVAAIRDILNKASDRVQAKLNAPIGSPGAPAQLVAPTAPSPRRDPPPPGFERVP